MAVCYKTPGDARGGSRPVSQSRLPHSHTHSIKASVLAGVAKAGPASLPPPAGVRGENPSGGFSNRVKWEKLATEERAGPRERRGRRQARASEASLQARRLPWEVTQLSLEALTTYPLENGGQKERKKSGARVVGLWRKPVLSNIYKHKAPSSVPPTSLPLPQKERPLRATKEVPRPPPQPRPTAGGGPSLDRPCSLSMLMHM